MLGDLLGNRVSLSSAYHPESDGQTERVHRTVEKVLSCMLSQHELPEDRWSSLLDCVELVLNLVVQDSMGVSPAQLVYGQDLRLLLDVLLGHVGRVPAAETFA